MSVSRDLAVCAGAALLLAAPAANAAPLTIVNVGAPAINCVFNPACTVVATDSVAGIPNPAPTSLGRLQTRTFSAAPGAPANGLTGYLYRIDLSSLGGSAAPLCVSAFKIAFGPAATLHYPNNGPLAEVFVVNSGALGSVAPSAADLTGTTLTFTFRTPVCAGQSSFFFGLASRTPPVPTDANVMISQGSQSGWANVIARSPNP